MHRAIELSERAAIKEKTGGVFGAVIVKDNEIISEGYNQVIKYNDPTWHAEIQAISEAGNKLGSPHLKGCVLYTSAYTCPMCFWAAYWAHIEHIFYGSRIEDAVKYGNFEDTTIFEQLCKKPEVRVIGFTEMMRNEAVEIWKKFAVMPDRVWY